MASSTVPGWVESLRIVLRESVGPSYSVMEQAGKARLQVRFRNGNRKTTTLDYEWQKANSRKITEEVEEIARLLNGGRSWDEVVAVIKRKTSTAPIPADEPQPDLLLRAFDIWSVDYMYKQTRKIEKSTLDGQYAKARKRLSEVSNAANAHEL